MVTFFHSFLFVLTCAVLIGATVWHGARARHARDFTLAGRDLSTTGVSWVIIGTLVGGASTVGTVQMAFMHGMAAWYFTLGSGIACLVLALCFAGPLRRADVTTVAEYVGQRFGPSYRLYASAITSLGMFVHIIAQFLAVMAIVMTLGSLTRLQALLVTCLLHVLVVAAGGLRGAAWLGRAKCVCLYLLLVVCAGVALWRSGGPWALLEALPAGEFGFFAYGIQPGLVDMLSVVIGVLSTQIYLQALFAARDVQAARRGAVLAAVLIPPLGLLGIIVGLHVRGRQAAVTIAHGMSLAEATTGALPSFINDALPGWLAACFMALLLVVVLGTGAGLTLGVTTNVYRDWLIRFLPEEDEQQSIRQVRFCSVLVLLLVTLVVAVGLDDTILAWSYLSMGLRGSAVLLAIVLCVYAPSLTSNRWLRGLLYLLPVLYLFVRLFAG